MAAAAVDRGGRDRRRAWHSHSSTCRILATSAASFGAPTRSARPAVVAARRDGRSIRMAGPSIRDGQHVSDPVARAEVDATAGPRATHGVRVVATTVAERRAARPISALKARRSSCSVTRAQAFRAGSSAGQTRASDPDAGRRQLTQCRGHRCAHTVRGWPRGIPPVRSTHDSPTALRRRRHAAARHAARRAHAAADARRVRRPGAPARARPAAAAGHRQRRAAFAHPLGPARHRQDDAGAAARRRSRGADFVAFSAVTAGIKEIREVIAAAEPPARGPRPAHDPVRRRDPSLQQGAAGRVPAARRGGRRSFSSARRRRTRRSRSTRRCSRDRRFTSCSRSRPTAIVTILRRALADAERGLGRVSRGGRRRALLAHRRVRERRRARALNVLELAVAACARPPTARGVLDTAALSALHRTARAALRQVGRRALQHHLGAAQVDPQQRRRRARVLARAHARGRRGPAVRRAPARAVRVGGRRQRRSARARCRAGGARTRCTSSACRSAIPRWPRRSSTWRRRRRATPSIAAYQAASPRRHAGPRRARAAAPAKRADRADEGARYGEGYRYAHDEAEGVAEMSCLPPHLKGRRYYEPTDRGLEPKIQDALERARRIRESREVDESERREIEKSGSRKVKE